MASWDAWNLETAEGRRRSWIPYAFIGFFVVVVGVNAVMLTVAIDTFSGIETPSHYVRGLGYNQNLDAVAEQQRRGWHADTVVADTPEAVAAMAWPVSLSLTDKAGRPLQGAKVDMRFVRPTSDGQDRDVMLHETAPGTYTGLAELPMRGQWDLRLLVWHPDGNWQSVERIFLDGR